MAQQGVGQRRSGTRRFWTLLLCLACGAGFAAEQDELDALFSGSKPADEASTEASGRVEKQDAAIPLPPSVPPVEPSATPRQVEEIVVTATKRERALRDLPISINAFSGQTLEDSGRLGSEEILKFSPGVTVNPGDSGDDSYISIRGVTASSNAGFYTRPVGAFLGEVSLVNPSIVGPTPDIEPFDLSAVEVLKGPQGTLFGGSALSGAIRYIPAEPEYGEPGGRMSYSLEQLAESGQWGQRPALMWNHPLGDSLALRLAVVERRLPGVVDDLHAGQADIDRRRNRQGRVSLGWLPRQDLELRLAWFRRDTRQADGSSTDNPSSAKTELRRLPDRFVGRSDIASLDMSLDLDAVSLVGSLARLDKAQAGQVDITQQLGLQDTTAEGIQHWDRASEQMTGEWRLVSSAPSRSAWRLLDGWDFLIGLFVLRSDQRFSAVVDVRDSDVPLPPDLVGLLPGGELGTNGAVESFVSALAEEHALFFDLGRPLGPTLELNLGGRFYRQVTTGDTLTGSNGQTLLDSPGRLVETGFNPRLALTWSLHERFSLFGSAGRGFRFGGLNQNIPDPEVPTTFGSDSLWNYELGLRSEWLNRRLTMDLTGYLIDWRNLQIGQSYRNVISYVDNVGGARVRGLELSSEMLLPAALSLSLAAAYTDSRTTTAFDSADGEVPPHSRLPATPFVTASAVLAHSGQLGPARLSSNLSFAWRGSSVNDLGETDYRLPAQASWGASVSVSCPSWPGAPAISLIGTNLTNQLAPISSLQDVASGQPLYWLSRPRSLSLRLSLHY